MIRISSLLIILLAAVIDLGEIQVEGELRRPDLQWIDSSKVSHELLEQIFKNRFESLENKLVEASNAPL